jgi:hypothetical protein
MATQQLNLLVLPLRATAAIAKSHVFVSISGVQSCATAAAAANAIGVADNIVAIGEIVNVATIGTARVKIGAAVTAGALIEADATGRAITRTAGVILARALETGATADQEIEVLLLPN